MSKEELIRTAGRRVPGQNDSVGFPAQVHFGLRDEPLPADCEPDPPGNRPDQNPSAAAPKSVAWNRLYASCPSGGTRPSRFHALRASQQKIAIRIQRIVERGQHFLLERDAQIDEKITATDEIHPGEGWILGDVLHRKDTKISHLLADLIAIIDFDEKFPQALGRNIGRNILRIRPSRATEWPAC